MKNFFKLIKKNPPMFIALGMAIFSLVALLIVFNTADFSNQFINAEVEDPQLRANISPDLSSIELENSKIKVKYQPQDLRWENFHIREFIVKEAGNKNLINPSSEHNYIDADSSRGRLAMAELIENTGSVKTVRMTWNNKDDDNSKQIVHEVSIFPNQPYLRVRYIDVQHGVNHVDLINQKGQHVAYGGDSWARGYFTHDEKCDPTNNSNCSQTELEYQGTFYTRWTGSGATDPKVADPVNGGALNYNGYFLNGVFDPADGIGLGRVMPVEDVNIVKLLMSPTNRSGLEHFSHYIGQSHDPFIGYIFPIVGGESGFMTRAKAIVDGADIPIPPVTTQPPVVGGDLSFDYQVIDNNLLTDGHASDVEVADINRDGNIDIWLAGDAGDSNSHQMAWYKGRDWQRFPIKTGDYFGGNWTDVDGDGDMDLAVSEKYRTKRFVWLENNGNPEQSDGNWQRHEISNQFDADVVYDHDFNGDGKIDFVVMTHIDGGKGKVYYLQQGSDPKGTWGVYLIGESSAPRTGGVIGDLDNDGDVDIVWGNVWLENRGNLTARDGADGWQEHVIDSSWPQEARAVINDLDGDGRKDIILSGEESTAGVAWYKAPSDPRNGTWEKKPVVSEGYEGTHTLQLADFNGDGKQDILAAEMHTGTDPDKIAVFVNQNIATNSWEEVVIANTGTHNAKVADLNKDGKPDIVGKNWKDLLRLESWINTTVGGERGLDNWRREVIDNDRGYRAVAVLGGDLDQDGDQDIVSGGFWYANPAVGGGTWTKSQIGGNLKNAILVDDLDGDGKIDIFGTKGEGSDANADLVMAQNNGSGNFTYFDNNIPNGEGNFVQGAGLVVNGNNRQVVLSWHSNPGDQLQAWEIPADLSANWNKSVLFDFNGKSTKELEIADIDGDGDQDIMFVGDSDDNVKDIGWLRNNNGSWEFVAVIAEGKFSHRLELADINGDGRLDAVIGHYLTNPGYVAWYEQPSNPTNQWQERIIDNGVMARNPLSIAVADFDLDGDMDVAIGDHRETENLVVMENFSGDGSSWQSSFIYTGDEHHQGVIPVDLDNDGDPDIASIGWDHNRVALYYNENTFDAPNPTNPPNVTDPPSDTIECGAADVNGDEKFSLVDFEAFARNYQKKCSDVSPTFQPKNYAYAPCGGKDVVRLVSETNPYGVINLADFASFASRYLQDSCSLTGGGGAPTSTPVATTEPTAGNNQRLILDVIHNAQDAWGWGAAWCPHPDSPQDWLEPYNYFDGTIQMRTEVFSKRDKDIVLMLYLSHIDNATDADGATGPTFEHWDYWEDINTPGVYTDAFTLESMGRRTSLDGGSPPDWSEPLTRVWTTLRRGDDWHEVFPNETDKTDYIPLSYRVTVYVVPEGESFIPPEGWESGELGLPAPNPIVDAPGGNSFCF